VRLVAHVQFGFLSSASRASPSAMYFSKRSEAREGSSVHSPNLGWAKARNFAIHRQPHLTTFRCGMGVQPQSGSAPVDLPIHCKIIRTSCNAIQTLLQVNSNNHTNTSKLRALSRRVESRSDAD
jgi:hypothetical protein